MCAEEVPKKTCFPEGSKRATVTAALFATQKINTESVWLYIPWFTHLYLVLAFVIYFTQLYPCSVLLSEIHNISISCA